MTRDILDYAEWWFCTKPRLSDEASLISMRDKGQHAMATRWLVESFGPVPKQLDVWDRRSLSGLRILRWKRSIPRYGLEGFEFWVFRPMDSLDQDGRPYSIHP